MKTRSFLIIALLLATLLPAARAEKSVSQDAPAVPQDKTASDKQKPDDKIRLQSKLVSTVVTVSDTYGRFVTGLRKGNFEVYDNNVRQEISHFSDEDAPLTLGIIYDVSNSMSSLTGRAFQALKRFFETSHEDDEYFIVAFNNKPQLVQDFTTSPSEIMSRVIFVKAKGSTALFDATYIAVEKARQGRHPKKALLIISDGMENNSRYSGKELRRLLQESGVQIYSIGIADFLQGAGTLEMLSNTTGGRAFFPMTDGEVGDIYTRIAVMLRHQYVIGFYPTDTTSSVKQHEVRIKLQAPKGLGRLSLYYKKSYPSFAD
jgi:Ca-activated chloride channel family protein